MWEQHSRVHVPIPSCWQVLPSREQPDAPPKRSCFPLLLLWRQMLLPAEACMPACKEDILAGMSPASVQHISSEEQLYWSVSPCQLLGPVCCGRGSPGALSNSASGVVTLDVGASSSMATPVPTGGGASDISRELPTARGAALPHGLPASRSQLSYFPSLSNAVLAACLPDLLWCPSRWSVGTCCGCPWGGQPLGMAGTS